MKGKATKILAVAVVALLSFGMAAPRASAQQSNPERVSLGVDLGQAAWFGTIGVDFSYAVGRHWTTDLFVRYNPWKWEKKDGSQINQRVFAAQAGARWWPWHAHSGWYWGGGVRGCVYNQGGLFSDKAEEGTAWGLSLGGGYALMLGGHCNLEFGLSGFAGIKNYTKYSCTVCGREEETGKGKWFIWPDVPTIRLTFVF